MSMLSLKQVRLITEVYGLSPDFFQVPNTVSDSPAREVLI